MSARTYKIVLNNPCHENWSEMATVDRGRYCDSCNKTVVDFRSFTEEDFVKYFSENGLNRGCGRFYQSQVERLRIVIDGSVLHANISWWKKFLVVFLICFGQDLFHAEFVFSQDIQRDSLQQVVAVETAVDTTTSTLDTSGLTIGEHIMTEAMDSSFAIVASEPFIFDPRFPQVEIQGGFWGREVHPEIAWPNFDSLNYTICVTVPVDTPKESALDTATSPPLAVEETSPLPPPIPPTPTEPPVYEAVLNEDPSSRKRKPFLIKKDV